MGINFGQVLKDLDGNNLKEIINGADDKPKPVNLTLDRAASNALMSVFEDERGVTGDEKLKRFLLAKKIRGAKDVKLTAEDIATIKKVMAKLYGPLVYGVACEILDPASLK